MPEGDMGHDSPFKHGVVQFFLLRLKAPAGAWHKKFPL